MKGKHKPYGPYERFVKRPLDCVLAVIALILLSPVLGIVALLIKRKLGPPVLFTQMRPGLIDPKTGRERIFKMYKFRTMTDARDQEGNLLPDEMRLTAFGKLLRSTSLDELPELWNIIKGDMAVIGPRPQLVRDMVFMSDEQRQRHTVRPGLSGLAQIRGRNAIDWETKLNSDLEYIKKITFLTDIKIILKTVWKVLKREGISEDGMDTAVDYGDYLLNIKSIDQRKYNALQNYAGDLLQKNISKKYI